MKKAKCDPVSHCKPNNLGTENQSNGNLKSKQDYDSQLYPHMLKHSHATYAAKNNGLIPAAITQGGWENANQD